MMHSFKYLFGGVIKKEVPFNLFWLKLLLNSNEEIPKDNDKNYNGDSGIDYDVWRMLQRSR